MNFCPNCGKELKENADICLNCGRLIEKKQEIISKPKIKVPRKGISIAGMILGIIAIVGAVFEVISLNSIIEYIELNNYYFDSEVTLTAYVFGYTLFSFIPSLIGFILSSFGFMKHKSGFNITGLVLNSISLAVSILLIVYFLFMY